MSDRPLVRYHGGKWRLAPWIISHFPTHRIYTEAYGGGASVLLRKPRSYAEVYNDLDREIVNLFKVVRDNGDILREKLLLTPFAREEFLEAWYPCEDSMEQARRTIIRAFMGFGSAAVTMARAPEKGGRGGLAKTGFRANSNRSGTTPAMDWKNYPNALEKIIERLRGVVIENRDAQKVFLQHDSDDTLHYVDPPYVKSTRDMGNDYRYEMDDSNHIQLADTLKNLHGFVVLSGYRNELYDDIYSDWSRIDKAAFADGARPRIECLWLNKQAQQKTRQLGLIA